MPLLLTVYLLVSFKKFKLGSARQGWCDLPPGYARVKLDDVLSASTLSAMQGKSPEATEADSSAYSSAVDY